jgi:hypothetical protein
MYAAMPAGYLGRGRMGDHARRAAAAHGDDARQLRDLDPAHAGLRERARRLPLRQADHVLADGPAFTSQGDINFVNFKAYRTISKDGVQIAESMHLYFDADSTAFRATFRVDGQPTFKQSIAQARGAQALSPYVTLQAR